MPSHRIAHASCAIVALCAALAGTGCLGSETQSAEARLDALRNRLVDQALAGTVRLQTAAWFDQSGQLHESTLLRANLQVHGTQVVAQPDDARPAARLPGGTETCRADAGRFKRHVELRDIADSGRAVAGYHFMPELAAHARHSLVTAFSREEAWSLSVAPPATQNAYERALFGSSSQRAAAYSMQLQLEASSIEKPAGALPSVAGRLATMLAGGDESLVPPRPLRLTLKVFDRASARLLWQGSRPLEYPAMRVSFTREALPGALLLGIEEAFEQWRSEIARALSCEPILFSVVPGGKGEIAIEAGATAGLRSGDQLLLVDRTRFPAGVLDPQVTSRSALIEVTSVSPGRAVARHIAGPAPDGQLQTMVALPF